MTTMKAVVFRGEGRIAIEEVPKPVPGPGEAVIKITATTICGTDVHIVRGEYPVKPGLVLGHEPVGIIEELGAGLDGYYRVGERVIAGAITPCGQCFYCLNGTHSQCGGPLGGWRFGNTINGAWAEYLLVPDARANLASIPADLADEDVLMCPDIFSTGLSGAESGNIKVGDSVAIFAQGPIGLCATVGAKLRGAGLIIAIDPVLSRLETARRFGASVTLNPDHGDLVEAIKLLTDGRGVDVAIEALGKQETFENALRSTRAGGTLSSLGVYSGKLVAPYEAFYAGLGDQKIVTTLCPGGKERMRRLMEMIARRRVDLSAARHAPVCARRHRGRVRALQPSARWRVESSALSGTEGPASRGSLRKSTPYTHDAFRAGGSPHRARRCPPGGLRRAVEARRVTGSALSNDDSRRRDRCGRRGRSSARRRLADGCFGIRAARRRAPRGIQRACMDVGRCWGSLSRCALSDGPTHASESSSTSSCSACCWQCVNSATSLRDLVIFQSSNLPIYQFRRTRARTSTIWQPWPAGSAMTGLNSSSASSGICAPRYDTFSSTSRRAAQVGLRLVAVALQQREPTDAADHFVCVAIGERCDAEGDIAEELDLGASQSERDERPEHRVLRQADERLGAVVTIGWMSTPSSDPSSVSCAVAHNSA